MMHVVTAAKRHLFEDELLELCRGARPNFAGGAAANAVARAAGGFGPFDCDDAVYLPDTEDGLLRGGSIQATRAFHGIDEPVLMRRTPQPSVNREIAL